MSFSQHALGQRLQEARNNCRISQQAAADVLGVPRSAISLIESGNRSVSTVELAQLAELYRLPVADFFFGEAEGEDDPLVALRRIAPGLDTHAGVSEQIAHCLSICRDGFELEQMLGHAQLGWPPTYNLPAPRTTSQAVAQGEQVAGQERQRLGLGNAPIADMANLIFSQGIWASGVNLPGEMSGFFLRHATIGMAIVVNFDYVQARKRFSYAHEYAHALMDRDRRVTISTRQNASEFIEARANAFAAAFLMPPAGMDEALRTMDKGYPSRQEQAVFEVAGAGRIRAERRPVPGSQAISYPDVAMLAHHFGVSYQAAVYRLRTLNVVLPSQCDGLLAQEQAGKEFLSFLNMLDDIDSQEDKVRRDRELKGQVVHLAAEAYRREEISRGRLLDISKKLGVPGRRLVELAETAREG